MAKYQTVWGLGFQNIRSEHQRFLNATFENLLKNLGDSILSSNFQSFQDYVKDLNSSSTFDFITELSAIFSVARGDNQIVPHRHGVNQTVP